MRYIGWRELTYDFLDSSPRAAQGIDAYCGHDFEVVVVDTEKVTYWKVCCSESGYPFSAPPRAVSASPRCVCVCASVFVCVGVCCQRWFG
jgi:hypothetical protein